MIDKSQNHQDKVNHIAHEIEGKLHHGEKAHSALHEEFHKLQKLDTHHGVLNKHQFKHDVHTVEAKLHKDGYLPHLKITNDHGSHIKISHSKHSFAPHEHGKHPEKLHPTAKQHLDSQHKKILHPDDSNHPKGSFHATNAAHPKGKGHALEKPHKGTAHPAEKPHKGTPHPTEKPHGATKHPLEAPHDRRAPGADLSQGDGQRVPPPADRRNFANPGRDAAPNVDPRLRRAPLDQPSGQDLPQAGFMPRPRPMDQRGYAQPPMDGALQPPPYRNPNEVNQGPGTPYGGMVPDRNQMQVPFGMPIRGGYGDQARFQGQPPGYDQNAGTQLQPYDQSGGFRQPPNQSFDPRGGFNRQQEQYAASYDQNGGFRRPPDQLQPPYDQAGAYRRPDQGQYGAERFNNTDRQREFEQGSDASKLTGRFTEIRLDQTTHAGNSPDALMYVRADFDPSKPVHLAVYNHGFGTRADNTLTHDQMKSMMANAEKNTVLIVPEWQTSPGSRSGASGAFQQGNKFTSMVQESFNKTPGLNGISLNNVDRIDIMSHSAGYSPTEAEIYKNPALANKVHSITLLDSLYDQHGFDRWLSSNINDLASGRKQFYNFSNTTTNERSAAQARYVQGLLRQQGLPTNNFAVDYGSSNGQVGRHASEMASRSIVFARTTVAHMQIPPQYTGAVLASVNREKKGLY